jgi:hypothetical protein
MSFCSVGIAIATIVWSMKVIETAKIIAARISLLFFSPGTFICSLDGCFPATSCDPYRPIPAGH